MPQVIDLRKIKKGQKKTQPKHIKIEIEKSIPTKLEWAAPEFTRYKKSKSWFVFLALIALAVITAAILLKNLLFVIVTILATFVVYIYALKKPRKIKFSISGKGIQIDQHIYNFEDLKSFWIFYEPPEVKEISFRSKKIFMPYIKISLGDQNPAEVRKLLLRFLPERKHRESIVDEWTRRIRF